MLALLNQACFNHSIDAPPGAHLMESEVNKTQRIKVWIAYVAAVVVVYVVHSIALERDQAAPATPTTTSTSHRTA